MVEERLVDQRQRGNQLLKLKDVYYGGTAGTKPDAKQLTERAGGDALRPYGPLGPKRIGEVTYLT